MGGGMADIKLPALPELNWTASHKDIGGPIKWVVTTDQLRARDLEVARCVLEAAAKACIAHDLIGIPTVYEIAAIRKCANAIRALEVSHD